MLQANVSHLKISVHTVSKSETRLNVHRAAQTWSGNTTVISTLRNDAVGTCRARSNILPDHFSSVAEAEFRRAVAYDGAVGGAGV